MPADARPASSKSKPPDDIASRLRTVERKRMQALESYQQARAASAAAAEAAAETERRLRAELEALRRRDAEREVELAAAKAGREKERAAEKARAARERREREKRDAETDAARASAADAAFEAYLLQKTYTRVCDNDPFLVTDLVTLGLVPSSHAVSLTWWCLGMADAVSRPPQVLMLGQYPGAGASVKDIDKMPLSNGVDSKELMRLEADVADKAALVENLREQLDQSTECCETLLDTVKEQENTIGLILAPKARPGPTHAVK
jgi:flagellar biosynthesis GTPase FlhF